MWDGRWVIGILFLLLFHVYVYGVLMLSCSPAPRGLVSDGNVWLDSKDRKGKKEGTREKEK